MHQSVTRTLHEPTEASSQGDRDHSEAVDHLAKGGVHVHHFEDPLIPWNGLTDDEIHNRHQDRHALGCFRWRYRSP